MKTIVCYGDSNTYGHIPGSGKRYSRDIRWPGYLAKLLGDAYYVIEEGLNGRTTVYDDPVEIWRNGKPYLRPCLKSHMPMDMIVLMLGTNDMKTRFGVLESNVSGGVAELIDIIIQFHLERQMNVPEILLVAPPEIGEGIVTSEFRDSFDENSVNKSHLFASSYENVAKEKGCRFLNAAKSVRPSEKDYLHLDESGHEKLAKVIAKEILS